MGSEAELLTKALDALITSQYGVNVPPKPIITPFGIRHLDALLGGGFGSNLPIMISSTPESGLVLAR
jgi:hypothetical protein